MESLRYDVLRDAVAGRGMAFRAVTELDPAGGDGDKVFPPTYQGGVYATEQRIIGGQAVPCVLLDSVQSQANRLEHALLDWHRGAPKGAKPFPLVQIDFSNSSAAEVGILSALEAPHRIADAVFLACEIEEHHDGATTRKPFRHPGNSAKGSLVGRSIDEASSSRATGLFGLCPTALLFGMWDSHGARGGLGEKFQRALVSEIIGVGVTTDNRRPASRIDPLITIAGESLPITVNDDKTWSLVQKGKGRSKLSEVGLGNVTPSLIDPKTHGFNHGGVTIQSARQITVLSMPALRRLRFPLANKSAEEQTEVNTEARTVLAALGLAAIAWQWANGFSLRSRCDLVPRGRFAFSLLTPGRSDDFVLSPQEASDILARAVEQAKSVGLPWPTRKEELPWKDGCLTLQPNEDLARAVARSRELAAEKRD